MIKSFASAIASLLVSGAMLATPSSFAQPEPSGAWLDSPTNWNQSASAIPQAPQIEGGGNLANCQLGRRSAALPEDRLVEAAGWSLMGAAQVFGKTTLVSGMANADGMCRPLTYQVFVFSGGQFIGTLSPIPMDSRTDGSLVDANLYREDYIGASFNRYQPEDALCCPSGSSRLTYEIKQDNNRSVLVPQWPASSDQ
ncbi:MAG: LppP/LprE family lipoprotein [Cyanobacteriota bacterium]|nr:LppP/LprE family lipoprotein [Cyanobacteriota bacterium]